MKSTEIHVPAARATQLFVRRFEPVDGPAPRTLYVVHGMGEHGGRYRHVVESIVADNWNVVVSDLRGYGKSGGRRAYVHAFDQHVDDLCRVFDEFGEEREHVALLGHSMGGLVSIRFVQEFSDRVQALALSSPCLRLSVRVPRMTLAAGRVCSFIVPRKRFRTTVDPSYTTRSEAVLEKRVTDPLMVGFVTARGFFQLRSGMARAMRRARRISCPVLILQAGEDKVVDSNAAREFSDRLNSSDVTCRHLDGQYHEVLNEPEANETLQFLKAWLNERVSTTAAAHVGTYMPARMTSDLLN